MFDTLQFTSLRNLRVLCGSAVMLLETETARDAENADVAQRDVDGFLSCRAIMNLDDKLKACQSFVARIDRRRFLSC
ncbi:MAG TPA: hypothetical protein VL866_06425 [Pyrinomonadaceae bacterium]|nr:hypothetical protein [Pyrinomonadaceae bacterium]